MMKKNMLFMLLIMVSSSMSSRTVTTRGVVKSVFVGTAAAILTIHYQSSLQNFMQNSRSECAKLENAVEPRKNNNFFIYHLEQMLPSRLAQKATILVREAGKEIVVAGKKDLARVTFFWKKLAEKYVKKPAVDSQKIVEQEKPVAE